MKWLVVAVLLSGCGSLNGPGAWDPPTAEQRAAMSAAFEAMTVSPRIVPAPAQSLHCTTNTYSGTTYTNCY